MPGKNCAIPGCPACKSRHKGLSFFRIRRPDDEEWEKALIKAVNRCDRSFNVENATICSRHFKPECYKEGKGTGCSLIRGSLPTEFMPKKSVETPKPPCRKPPFQRTAPDLAERVKYYNLEDVQKEVADGLPAPWCVLSTSCERIVLASVGEEFQIRLKLYITPDFAAVVSVFDFSAHELTTNIEKIGLKVHLHKLSSLQVCSGITDSLLQDFSELPGVDNQQPYFRHIQYSTDELGNIKHASSVRSKSCQLLLESPLVVCKHCRYAQTLLQRKLKRVEESNSKPVSVNNSLNCLTKEKLTKEYKTLRKENKRLQKEFKRSLETESIEVNPALHNSLKTVLDENEIQDPIQKLFWQEQSKAFRTGPQGMRWHPMMLRLAILLHSKSPAAYETLRNTGVLCLPGESMLRDYKNEYHPKPGFQKRALDDLRKTSETLGEHERFVVLLHDEMAIKSDLVFDKRSGEYVGFVNTQGQEPTGLATHALVFYVVGLSTTISTSIGFFGTVCNSRHTF